MSISCTICETYGDISLKSSLLTYPTSVWCPAGDDNLEFRRELWLQKTRVPRLSHGVVRVIPRLAVLVQYWL